MPLNNDDILALISILQKGLVPEAPVVAERLDMGSPLDVDGIPPDEELELPPNPVIGDASIVKRQMSNNKFDAMAERTMHKADRAIDKLLNVNPPTERSRAYRTMTAQCVVCGRQEEVSPSLVDSPQRYKCNKCSASGG